MADTITMVKDGQAADIPVSQYSLAISKGAKPAVSMRGPDGSEAWIPHDQIGAAMKAGAVITKQAVDQSRPTEFEQNVANQPTYTGEIIGGAKRFGASIVDLAKQLGAQPTTTSGKAAAALLGPAGALVNVPRIVAGAGNQLAQGAQARRTVAAQGEGLAGQTLATLEQYPVVGPIVQHAEQGAASPIPNQGLGTTANIGTPQAYGAATEGSLIATTPQLLKGAGEAINAIPSKARAGATLAQVKSVVGNMPIDTSAVGDIAMRTDQLAKSGGAMPKVIRDFIKRATDPNQGPITYAEGRDFYSNATRLSADEFNRLTPVMRAQIGQFTQELGRSLGQVANAGGVGTQYASGMGEYAAAARMAKRVELAKALAKHTVPYVAAAYTAKQVIGGK